VELNNPKTPSYTNQLNTAHQNHQKQPHTGRNPQTPKTRNTNIATKSPKKINTF